MDGLYEYILVDVLLMTFDPKTRNRAFGGYIICGSIFGMPEEELLT